MAKKKITTKKKEDSIARNRIHNKFQLEDGVLSDVPIEHVRQLFMLRQ